jgi:hypothetical protein
MYFINCGSRDHALLFGPSAFFDLGINGKQSTMAKNLLPGDTCIVARYADNNRTMVNLRWYSYARDTEQMDDKGTPQRVLHGILKKVELLTKFDAAADARYQHMFNKNGAFKRLSVLQMARA